MANQCLNTFMSDDRYRCGSCSRCRAHEAQQVQDSKVEQAARLKAAGLSDDAVVEILGGSRRSPEVVLVTKTGNQDCVVGSRHCRTYSRCQACRDEERHQENLARRRAENAAPVMVDMDPAAAAIGLGLVGLGLGTVKLVGFFKDRKAAKAKKA